MLICVVLWGCVTVRMYLLQNTREACDFELLIAVHEDAEASLLRLKDGDSYEHWNSAVQPWLQTPRSSQRFDNITST